MLAFGQRISSRLFNLLIACVYDNTIVFRVLVEKFNFLKG